MAEKKISFEQAMARLEEIVTQLEQGDAPLEDALALGSDFDGADLPPCLDGCGKVPGLGRYLEGRLGRAVTEKILWKNALSFFHKNI